MTIAALILAAGAGSRFRGPEHKLLAPLPGGRDQTVLGSVLDAAIGAQASGAVQEVIVVWGAVDLAGTPGLDRVALVHHAGWAHGQASSLHAGLAAARDGGHDVVVVCPGDQPGVTAEAFELVALVDAPVVAARYDHEPFAGGPRPPVRLDQRMWQHLPSDGDEGARAWFRGHPESVRLVPVPGDPSDIDTVEDLERWN